MKITQHHDKISFHQLFERARRECMGYDFNEYLQHFSDCKTIHSFIGEASYFDRPYLAVANSWCNDEAVSILKKCSKALFILEFSPESELSLEEVNSLCHKLDQIFKDSETEGPDYVWTMLKNESLGKTVRVYSLLG